MPGVGDWFSLWLPGSVLIEGCVQTMVQPQVQPDVLAECSRLRGIYMHRRKAGGHHEAIEKCSM